MEEHVIIDKPGKSTFTGILEIGLPKAIINIRGEETILGQPLKRSLRRLKHV